MKASAAFIEPPAETISFKDHRFPLDAISYAAAKDALASSGSKRLNNRAEKFAQLTRVREKVHAALQVCRSCCFKRAKPRWNC